MARAQKWRAATHHEARVRLGSARAYLEVADLVQLERDQVEMPGVAAALAVLAGIAASDAICAERIGEIHRGDDHRLASELLKRAVPDGSRLAATFLRLIDLKDEAHYGVLFVSQSKATNAVRWARVLTDRAVLELER